MLRALLERPGELVTREELRSKLWPADTFVDFDHSLNAAIKRLREALGESADSPVLIETLARRGYRFIVPVSSPVVSGGIESAPSRGRSQLPFVIRRVAIACLASIVIVAALVSAIRWHPSSGANAKEQKLTSNSSENSVNSATISPDGKYLAYTDNTGLYLKLIRTGETHAVTLPAAFSAHVDDWFPDGSHLLVSRTDSLGKTSLWNISIFGGSPRLLADDASGGSSSPDGARVAFHRADLTYEGWFGREVWIMRSDGTEAIKVASDSNSLMGTPTWSPDGKRIAYVKTALAYNSPWSLIEVNEWERAKTEPLYSDHRLRPGLEWLSDGRLIYGVNTGQGPRDSSMFAATILPSGKLSAAPKRIAHGSGGITQVSGSADGKVLACLREHWSPSIYIGTLTADGATLRTHRRLTLDENASIPTAWTPDSTAVLFSSDRNGTSEIFKQNTDQSIAETLVTSIEQLSQPRLSPDGSEILYVSTPKSAGAETPSSILATPIAGGPPPHGPSRCRHLRSRVCAFAFNHLSVQHLEREQEANLSLRSANWQDSRRPAGRSRGLLEFVPRWFATGFRGHRIESKNHPTALHIFGGISRPGGERMERVNAHRLVGRRAQSSGWLPSSGTGECITAGHARW